MTTPEKQSLCEQHHYALAVMRTYGNGAMLLSQLREICTRMGFYPSGQAANRAARALRDADILSRQTWMDGNSDLLVFNKYAVRYFQLADSQSAATPHRPTTFVPYLMQARKIDWLLSAMEQNGLTSLPAVEWWLRGRGSTLFLRLPDLSGYYHQHASFFAAEQPQRFKEQLARMAESAAQRESVARHKPPNASAWPQGLAPVTLELMHRRGVYITAISPRERAVEFSVFPSRATSIESIALWALDTHQWLSSLRPYYHTILRVFPLDAAHGKAIRAALAAPVPGTSTSFWRNYCEGNHVAGLLHIAIQDTDFIRKWCGNVRRIEL